MPDYEIGEIEPLLHVRESSGSEVGVAQSLVKTNSNEGHNKHNKIRLKAFEYLKTKHFWIILLLGQVLSLCITSTNTFTTLLANGGNSLPALQSLFNYILLMVIFVPYTLYRYGPVDYWRMLRTEGWKFAILAFTDVQGNYFIVNAYNYTNMLSAALLDNLTIVFVVLLSYLFLHVRYHWTQLTGILICIGGVILIVMSDLATGKNAESVNALKGDAFVVLSSIFYGSSNVLQEFLVSKRPYYEVLGQLGFFGTVILGTQFILLESESLQTVDWSFSVVCYFMGYTVSLLALYLIVPIMFRMSSGAFYNLSLLTSDFWALLIGIRLFGYYVFWLYPVGFVFTVLGVVVYSISLTNPVGESLKPWLGEDQAEGIAGFGTAKRNSIGIVQADSEMA